MWRELPTRLSTKLNISLSLYNVGNIRLRPYKGSGQTQHSPYEPGRMNNNEQLEILLQPMGTKEVKVQFIYFFAVCCCVFHGHTLCLIWNVPRHPVL